MVAAPTDRSGKRPPRERADLEAALRKVYDLSSEDQLELFGTLRDYLGHALGSKTAADKQLDQRSGALQAMREAATYLQFEDLTDLTAARFGEAAGELGLDCQPSV